jgi:tRNA(Ile)-lysidine synthase
MPNLIKKVQNISFQNDLFEKGSKIILAVSGGPDSVAMLHIFSKLQPKYNLDLIVAHVNYNLRGADSKKDEEFVRSLAKKYNFALELFRPKIKIKNNLENYLRNVRYGFFEKIRKKLNFDSIAIAHNLDDQAETFLMRIIRGSGLQGLRGMQFKNRVIIRPFLGITRKEITAYLKEKKIAWRVDKTNLESKFLRNKIRNKLIPYLEENFNRSLRTTLFNSAASIAEDYDYISTMAERAESQIGEVRISILLALHPALQRRILRSAILKIKKDLQNIDALHIEEILKMAKSTKNKAQIVVFKGLKIQRRGDKLNINKF